MPNRPAQVVQDHLRLPDNAARLRDTRLNTPPPSISELVFQAPAEHVDEEHVLLAKSTLKVCREAAERARQIALSVLADETVPELGRHKSASEAIFKLTSPVLERTTRAINRLHAKQVALTDYLLGPKPPANLIEQMASMEARNALANLSPADRRKIVLAGLASGDASIANAACRVSPFIVGMSPEEQHEYQSRWADREHPEVVRLLATITQSLDAVERGGQLLLTYSQSLTSGALVKRATELSSRAQAAIASAQVGAE